MNKPDLSDAITAKEILYYKKTDSIVEKKLKIPPDYQYRAINSKNFLQANWHKNKMLMVSRLVELNKNSIVLDLGTGSGNFEMAYAKKVKRVIGVDYNDEALIYLQKKIIANNIKNVNLIQSDIRHIHEIKDLPKFDLIILMDVLEHLGIDDIDKLVQRLKNILNAAGKVVIITPNYHGLWTIIEYLLDIFGLVPKFREQQHLTQINKTKLIKIFKESGYQPDRLFTFNLFSFLIPARTLSKFICIAESKIPFPVGNLIGATFTISTKMKKPG